MGKLEVTSFILVMCARDCKMRIYDVSLEAPNGDFSHRRVLNARRIPLNLSIRSRSQDLFFASFARKKDSVHLFDKFLKGIPRFIAN